MLLEEFRKNIKSLPDVLPWAGLVDDGIVLTKSGGFLAAFEVRGPDLDSATREELVSVAARINAALRLTDGWTVYMDATRRIAPEPMLAGHYPDRTTKLIAQARALAREGESAGFETRHVLSLLWHPDPDAAGKTEAMFVEGGDTAGVETRNLQRFKSAIAEIADRFSGVVKIRRLTDRVLPDGSLDSPLLAYLQECVTFEQRERFIVPEVPMYLDAVLGRRGVTVGFEPRVGDKTVVAISIHGLPASSHPGILDFIGRLPVEFRWSNRFIVLGQRQADAAIKKYRSKWAQKRYSLMNLLRQANGGQASHTNLDAEAMTQDAVEAEGINSSGLVRFGYWTSVVLVAHGDAQTARDAARAIVKEIVNRGFDAAIEDVNAMEAYIGSMPGNTYANVRRPVVHTLNMAHFLPFTGVWPGPDKHPCPFYPSDSGPLLLVKTDGSTPYRLSLHDGDLGHTVIVGPPGSGKSTLLASIAAAQFQYRDAQVFAFDKGYSMQTLVLAAGGEHYDIAGEDATLAFCPLQAIDGEAEQSWASEWLEQLAALQGVECNPGMRKELYRAVVQLARQTPGGQHRTLTDYITVLQDQALREALEYYTLRGPAGALLDAENDGLALAHFQVFELEHLMQRGEKIVIPVLTYLFHRLEARFRGQPTLLVLDEAWLMLGHPVFRAKIREWLKVLRKANVAVVFATQSLNDLAASGIADAIFESCPSKILLANAEALTESVRPFYEAIGLNRRQIEIVAAMTPKRQYYHVHPDGRRVFELGLTAEELAFVSVSDKISLKRIAALRAADPEGWPAQWLHERGLPDAAQAWMDME